MQIQWRACWRFPFSTWKSNVGLMEDPLMTIVQSEMPDSLVKIGLMTAPWLISSVSITKAICMILANVALCSIRPKTCGHHSLPIKWCIRIFLRKSKSLSKLISPNNLNSIKLRQLWTTATLDKQHNSTNEMEVSEELDNFTDLHIDKNNDNQPLSESDSEWAVQLQHFIITHYLSTKKS